MNDGDLQRIIGAWSAFAALLVVIGPGGCSSSYVLGLPGVGTSAWSTRWTPSRSGWGSAWR